MTTGKRLTTLAAALAAALLQGTAAQTALAAAGPTASGRVSVAMAVEQLKAAGDDAAARDRVSSYLGGLVESMLALDGRVERASGGRHLFCKTAKGSLDGDELITAFAAAAPDQSRWAETEAAPIIVDHLLAKYPCPDGVALRR